MSADQKRPLKDALNVLSRFEDCFAIHKYCRSWLPAGSVRRERELIGDIEIVCRPRSVADKSFKTPKPVQQASEAQSGRKGGGGLMFGDGPELRPAPTNLILARLDEMLEDGYIKKQLKADNRPRWGERYRALTFEGWTFEIFVADDLNYGLQSLIRTGSADFSKEVVTRIMRRQVYRVGGGYLRPYFYGSPTDKQLREMAIIPAAQEEIVFEAAGMKWIEPKLREVA